MSVFPSIRGGGAAQRQLLQFGGLNRSDNIKEGEFAACDNVSTRRWPYLAPRQGKLLYDSYAGATALYSWDGRTVYVQDNHLYIDGQEMGSVSHGEKQFAVVNSQLCVFPDKVIVDLHTGEFKFMGGSVTVAGNVTLTGSSLSAPSDQLVGADTLGTEMTGDFAASSRYNRLLYTYGRDRKAVSACWDGEAWDMDALDELEQIAGLIDIDGADYILDRFGAGSIIIPSETGGVYDYVLGTLQSGLPTSYPDRSAYNASGLYAVLTKPEKLVIQTVEEPFPATHFDIQWHFDVYQAGVENPLFSGTFQVGDAVTIEGTVFGFGDGERLSVTGIRDEDDTLEFPEDTFTVPEYVCELETALEAETACSMAVGSEWYQFSAESAVDAGMVIYTLPEDTTHVYVWDPAVKRTIDTFSASVESSAGTGRTELTAEEYDAASGDVEIRSIVPDLDFICASENRLWGVVNHQEERVWDPETESYVTFYSRIIYASALGEPAVFWKFAGLSTDSWQVADGTDGDFTAICPYGGRVLCWKGDKMTEVTGYTPDSFASGSVTVPGVQRGAHQTLVNINERLYYLGPDCVYTYAGSEPLRIGDKLGTVRHSGGVGWTDGKRYFLNSRDYRETQTEAWETLTYDTVLGLWMREDPDLIKPKVIAAISGARPRVLYAPGVYMSRWENETAWDSDGQSPVKWGATLCVFDEDLPHERKRLLRLLVRCKVENVTGAWLKFYVILADNDERLVREVTGSAKEQTIVIPIPAHREDKVLVRIEGRGNGAVMSIAREYTTGSVYGGVST